MKLKLAILSLCLGLGFLQAFYLWRKEPVHYSVKYENITTNILADYSRSNPFTFKLSNATNGSIIINLDSGAVEISEGMSMPDAAREFWKILAACYPEARRAICHCETNNPTPAP